MLKVSIKGKWIVAKKLKQEKYLNQEVKNQNSVKIKAPIVEAL